MVFLYINSESLMEEIPNEAVFLGTCTFLLRNVIAHLEANIKYTKLCYKWKVSCAFHNNEKSNELPK
jgi:hypothetical protein